MRAPLRVAAVQPACAALNVVGNAASHAAAVRSARSRLVVFPELSLTGYELHAPTVPLDGAMLEPIVDACGETGSVALVGAPVEADGARFIAMLRVDAAGVRVVYRKTWLGICKDTGAAQHTVGTAALGVDAYVAGLVHRPEELPEQEARAVVIARTCRAFVVFASFAGRTGHGYSATAGSSAIWSPDGLAVSRTGPDVGELARATLT